MAQDENRARISEKNQGTIFQNVADVVVGG
jgi:hypothetical protein